VTPVNLCTIHVLHIAGICGHRSIFFAADINSLLHNNSRTKQYNVKVVVHASCDEWRSVRQTARWTVAVVVRPTVVIDRQPDIRRESRFESTPPAFDAPVKGVPVGILLP